MRNQDYSIALPCLLEKLRNVLFDELQFRQEITDIINSADEVGLRLECQVKIGDTHLATYGDLGGTATGTEPFDIGPVRCILASRSSLGGLPQDLALAQELWERVRSPLQHVYREHWGAREPISGVWTGQDDSVQKKRQATVTEAVNHGSVVAFVRLDCDGFGAAKDRLGGEHLANVVILHVTEFFRTSLADQCLVFHPHGDEFELIFIGKSAHEVFQQLHHFQSQFKAHDFRPAGQPDPVTLGIRMAVAFWPCTVAPTNPIDILASLVRDTERVEFKERPDRGFIELAEDANVQSDGVLTIQAIQEAVLWAHRGLLGHHIDAMPNGLANCIAKCLLEDTEQETSLTERLNGLAKTFVLKVFSDTETAPFDLPPGVSASRVIHSAQLASVMLHVLLKRRFLGKGPLGPHDFIRISLRRIRETEPTGRLAIERQDGDSWLEVIGFDDVPARDELQVDAGCVWIARDHHLGDPQCASRWVPPDGEHEDLSPCIVALVGSKAESLAGQLRPWCAGVLKIDDRPVTSGHLPDFWQSNIGRIIGCCLKNPNIRALLLVRENPDAVRRTHDVLLGACRIGEPNGGGEEPWTADKISEIAAATTVKEPLLRRFKQRKVCLLEINADIDSVRQALVDVYSNTPEHLAAAGEPEQFDLKAVQPDSPEDGSKYEFRAASLGHVFPNVVRALRHSDTPRYTEPDGRQLAELTGVRVELSAPLQLQIPAYWSSDQTAFESYYTRAFQGPVSLFGSRLCRWGLDDEDNPGINQLERAVQDAVTAVTQGRVDRRIVLTTSQPPGNSGADPLGLSTIHLLPRTRVQSGTKVVYLDYLWVWRSVEAIVGFPFSMYGSVRFSNELTEAIRGAMPQTTQRSLALGTVTYLAISLHLYCDTPDLAIARHIDLEARP